MYRPCEREVIVIEKFSMMEREVNRHKFGFLEKGTNCTQVYVYHLSKLGRPML